MTKIDRMCAKHDKRQDTHGATLHFTLFFTTATDSWCRDTKFSYRGHITVEDFQKFRMGDYSKASDETQEKWLFVGLHLVTHVNTDWAKKDARLNRSMRKVVSASDEALVAWLFEAHLESTWKEQVKEDLANMEKQDQGPKKKRHKTAGVTHKSRDKVCHYFHWKKRFHEKRAEDTEESMSWDSALNDAVWDEQEAKTQAKKKGNGEGSDDGNETEGQQKKNSNGDLEKLDKWEPNLWFFDEHERNQI